MPDVFISYASEDREKVQSLAQFIEKAGLSVWWDPRLLPGDRFESRISKALVEAKVALVCWSHDAAESDWVQSEAEDARRAGKLVCVKFDGTKIPKPFDRYHAEDFGDWAGVLETPATVRLIEALKSRAEGRPPEPVPLQRQWITRGAISAFIVGAFVTIGWVSGIIQPLIMRDKIADVGANVREVRSAMDELRDEILTELRAQAGASGMELSSDSEATITTAIDALIASSDARKRSALEKAAKGDFETAAQELLSLAEEQTRGIEKTKRAAAATFKEAGALLFAIDTKGSVSAYKRALVITPDDLDAHNQLGKLYLRLGQLKQSEEIFQHMLELADERDLRWNAIALGNLGRIAWKRGDLDEAEQLYHRALMLERDNDNQFGISQQLGNLGVIAWNRGDLDDAEDFHGRALATAEEIESDIEIARHVGNLGLVSMDRGELESAEAFLNRALRIDEARSNFPGVMRHLLNLGLTAQKKGDLDSAESFTQRALEINHKIAGKESTAIIFSQLGIIQELRGEYAEADTLYHRALAVNLEMGNKDRAAINYTNLGELARARNDMSAATEYYNQSLKFYESVGNKSGIAVAYVNLGEVAMARGDVEPACQLLARASDIFETIRHRYFEYAQNKLAEFGCAESDQQSTE